MISPPRHIAFFVTGHGFGHGVRTSALMHGLPAGVELSIFSSLPENFFKEETARPFRYFPGEIDCGCIQPDSVDIDIKSTLETYRSIDGRREEIIAGLVPRLHDLGVDCVVGDIPPPGLRRAARAHIPSLAVGNFTWVDIYEPYLGRYPEYAPMVARMKADYALADRYAQLLPGMPNMVFPRAEEMGVLARTGRDRRAEFAVRFGLDPEKTWCLVYMGSHGIEGMDWSGFGRIPGTEFFGLYTHAGASDNYHVIGKDPSYSYADLTASCDIVLGKLGYGLVSECLVLGKPVLFIGRRDFSEFPFLKQALTSRGQGMEIPFERLKNLEIGKEMEILTQKRFDRVPADGLSRLVASLGF